MVLACAFLSMLYLFSCGSDEPADPQPDDPPAISSISPTSGPVGTEVTISGMNFSTSATSNIVTFNGITANVTSATATQLKAKVPNGAATGAVAVTVNGKTATGPVFSVDVDNSSAIIYDCALSDITENTTWEDQVSGNGVDYIITCEIVVKGTALLTIEPGVIIQFEGDLAGIFTDESGGLKAVGTPVNPIQFLGTSSIPGVWKGIYFGSTHPENRLEHVTVSHAGRTASGISNEKGAVQLNDKEDSKGAIINTTVINNDGYGIVITDESEISEFSNNTINDNELAPVLIYFDQLGHLDSGTDYQGNGDEFIEVRENELEDDPMTIINPGIPYRFIESKKYLVLADFNIAAGTVLEFITGAGIRLGDVATDCTPATGSLNATGSSTERIVFKGVTDGVGTWLGIGFNSSSTNNKLIYTDVIGGGSGKIYNSSNVKDANVALACESKVFIQNSTFQQSGGYGVFVDDEEAVLDEFENNTMSENELAPIHLHFIQLDQLDDTNNFTGDNGDEFIEVTGTALIDNDLVVPKLDLPYRMLVDDFDRETFIEKNLTISPGVVMEFEPGAGIILGSPGVDCIPLTGSINAEGTADEKIIFKGINEGPGNWVGIGVNSGSSLNVFDFVEISGGGGKKLYNAGGYGNIVLSCDGKLTLTNSVISDSGGWGVDIVNGGSLTESDNTFDNNDSGNIND